MSTGARLRPAMRAVRKMFLENNKASLLQLKKKRKRAGRNKIAVYLAKPLAPKIRPKYKKWCRCPWAAILREISQNKKAKGSRRESGRSIKPKALKRNELFKAKTPAKDIEADLEIYHKKR